MTAARRSSRLAQIIGSLLALAVFIFAAMAAVSGYLVYQIVSPPRSPAHVDIALLMGHPTDYKFDIPGEGTRDGWFFPGLLHAPTIILCHGYGSQRADILTLTTAIQEQQYNVFLFDFTGHGATPGRTTLGYTETHELLAAIAGLAKRDDIDTSRFGVWGVDLGAYSALSAAIQDARIKAVAVDSAYDKPPDLLLAEIGQSGLGSLPGVKTLCLFDFRMLNYPHRMDLPISSYLSRLQGTPKLFIETTDRSALSTATLRLFQAAPAPKTQIVDSLAYSEMGDEDRRNYESRVVSFFLSNLPPSTEAAQ
jgi:pimeloyl-ACP methyl ester carboxylesterase